MFLYILDIAKYNCIKIGIASSIARVESHIRTYEEIDLENSYIVNAKDDRTIRQLEKQLLNDYFEYKIINKDLEDKDGYSELRERHIIDDALEDINYKANKFNNKEIEIIKGIRLDKYEKPVYTNISSITKQYLNDENNSINNENVVAKLVDFLSRNKDNIIGYSDKDGIINGIRIYLKDDERDYLFYKLASEDFIFNCGRSSVISDFGSYREGSNEMCNVSFKLQYYDDIRTKKYYDEIQFRINKLINKNQRQGSDIKNDIDKEMRKRLWSFN